MKKWLNFFNTIQWKLVVIYLLLILMAIQIIGVYFMRELEDFYTDVLKKDLQRQANLLHDPIGEVLEDRNLRDSEKKKELNHLLNQLVFLKIVDKTTPTVLIQIIDTNGFVLASTTNKEGQLIKKRIPIEQALRKRDHFQVLSDPTNNQVFQIYVRPLIGSNDRSIGTIYIEASLKNTYSTIRHISKILIKITFIALAITTLLMIVIARTITNPVKEIHKQASRMASGDFSHHVDVLSKDEIGSLANEFNHLASHLREALAQNEEEKTKLESVLAHMSDGVIATNLEGLVIVKNEPAQQLLNRPIPLNQPLHTLLPLKNTTPFSFKQPYQTFLEVNSEEGTRSMIKLTLTPIKVQGDEVIGSVAVLVDVTEQAKLNRKQKEFVANVSHELRTPLTTIKSYIEALEDGAIEDPDVALRFLSVARQESERMTRLIHDLLQLSRMDAKEAPAVKEVVDIQPILNQAINRFTFQCRQKPITLSLHSLSPLSSVYIDRDKIDQVLDNLLSNAIAYTPSGGSVALIARQTRDGMVEIAVADTGIGIPKSDLGRIFERFYRVDKARSRGLGGTGLGLAIAQEIVHAHEGKITIFSYDQRGTTVSFTLPSCQVEVIS